MNPKEIPEYLPELIAMVINACDIANQSRGIMCTNTKCVFHIYGNNCGLKNVYIINGKCPYYNPELLNKFDDLFPEMANRPGSKLQE